MAFEKPKRKIIVIDSNAPTGSYASEYVAWFDTASKTVKFLVDGAWVVQVTFDSLIVGYTGEVTAGSKILVFQSSLLLEVRERGG